MITLYDIPLCHLKPDRQGKGQKNYRIVAQKLKES